MKAFLSRISKRSLVFFISAFGIIWLNFAQPVIASSVINVADCLKMNSALGIEESDCKIIAQVSPQEENTDNGGSSLLKRRIAREIANLSLESPVGFFNIFIIFFVTLGPLKIISPFVQLTQNADRVLRQQLAIRSAALSTLIIILVTAIGQNMVKAWRIQLPALLIAGGILLFLVSLQIIMSQYASVTEVKTVEQPSLKLVVKPLVFPTILPPFGIAIALTMMVISQKIGINSSLIVGLLVLVMGINLIAMLAARPILAILKPITLIILGFALIVMQFALGLELIIAGIEIEVLVLQQLLKP